MPARAYIRGSACKHCGAHIGDAREKPSHERHCEFNPALQCRFCGLRFGGPQGSVEKRAHEKGCASNPSLRCRFCGTQFSGTEGAATKRTHERECDANPALQCRHCGESFGGRQGALAKRTHEKGCASNPALCCRFCGEQFGGPAGAATKRTHERECDANPASQCRHCGESFGGRQGALAKRTHEKHCALNPALVCQYCNEHFGGPAGGRLKTQHEKRCASNPSLARPDDLTGDSFVMYHGTSRSNAASIERHGFWQSSNGMLGPGVYLSKSLARARRYGQAVLEVFVDVGRVQRIDYQGHPLQKTWSEHGYDTAWVPPNCGMVSFGLEENCVRDPSRIVVLRQVNTSL